MIKYILQRTLSNDFISLCDLLDSELNDRVGGKEKRLLYQSLNSLDNIEDFYIAYIENQPVGCACYKKINASTIELKRVFVKKEFRKKGIAKKLIKNIIKDATEKGYKELILETGKPLFEAMKLYELLGFYYIVNYGPYKNMKHSICMKKILGETDETI